MISPAAQMLSKRPWGARDAGSLFDLEAEIGEGHAGAERVAVEGRLGDGARPVGSWGGVRPSVERRQARSGGIRPRGRRRLNARPSSRSLVPGKPEFLGETVKRVGLDRRVDGGHEQLARFRVVME